MVVELKPHQQEAVKKMHNGCILYGGTGVGKTITALAYFFEEVCGGEVGQYGFVQGARDLYVITTAKKRDTLDWQHEALHFGITTHDDDNVNGINLVVDSWNNIDKYKDVKDAFFIFDEQRLVGSGAWTKAFIKIAKSNEWVLLSATPGDTWLDYIPVFVANGFYKNRTQFKLRHVVYNTYSKFPKVERYLETGHLLRLRNQVLVHMPYERHTIRHEQIVHVDYDKDLMKKVEEERWHVYEKRPLRDVAEQLGVMRKVVNTDSSRLTALQHLMKTHPKIIVFYNFDYELEILRTLGTHSTDPSHPNSVTSSGDSHTDSASPSDESSTSETQSKESTSTSPTTRTSTSTHSDGRPTLDPTQKSTIHPLALEWQQMFRELEAEQVSMLEGRSETSTSKTSVDPGTSSSSGIRMDTNRSTATDTGGRPFEIGEKTPMTCLTGMEMLDLPKELLSQPGKTSSTTSSSSTWTDTSESRTKQPSEGKLSTSKLLKVHDDTSLRSPGLNVPTTPVSEQETVPGGTEATSDLTVAEWNGHKHEPIPTTDSWVYLVQYMAGSESWNCTETDTVVFWSQTYSYKMHQQARGRIDRMNTPFRDLWYVTFMSDSRIDKAVAKSLKQKKNFNEASVAPKW